MSEGAARTLHFDEGWYARTEGSRMTVGRDVDMAATRHGIRAMLTDRLFEAREAVNAKIEQDVAWIFLDEALRRIEELEAEVALLRGNDLAPALSREGSRHGPHA